MSKSNATELQFLQLIYNGGSIGQTSAYVADNPGSSALTDLWVALHTASPDENGTQGTNEAAYTSYARVATTRSTSTGGWSVTTGTTAGATVAPVSAITFPAATGGSETITHFSVGLTSSTTGGQILHYGTVTANIAVASGVTPRLTTGSSIRED